MPLKYQSEIDRFNLKECPATAKTIDKDIEVFRFSLDPIDHKLNFLPNVLFDNAIQSSFNYNHIDDARKCLRCGSSFYLKFESAINKWNNLPLKFKKNLGYTHLAKGVLSNGDGVMNEPGSDGHFTFYENEGADLKTKFNNTLKLQ